MAAAAAASDPLLNLLIAIPTVILACKAGAWCLRRLGQPPVVGEIAVGILLGPSLLGWVWPQGQQGLFPPEVLPFIGAPGDLGLLAFMFAIGLEIDFGLLRGQSRTAIAVSQASIALPLALGMGLALGMHGTFAPEGVGPVPFMLFIAVSMSITAFPVLARILADRGLQRTRVGGLALGCAAVGDVTTWCLLVAVVGLTAGGGPWAALTTVLLAGVYLLGMVGVVRPLLTWWARRAERTESDGAVMVVLFSGVCLSALATEAIGLHALFGAFVFGALAPRRAPVIERSASRLLAVAVPVLLPLFFVALGLRTDVSLLTASSGQWWWALAVLAVAVLGKWGGGAGAARLAGQSWRDSMAIGALMNCRGLTELVVLDIGLSLGVIGPGLFTTLVLMALATTAVTGPALSWTGVGGGGRGSGRLLGKLIVEQSDDKLEASRTVGARETP